MVSLEFCQNGGFFWESKDVESEVRKLRSGVAIDPEAFEEHSPLAGCQLRR